ncbi:MAG: hypothetical protein JXR70_04580 [Spirochaetales bacterium]|nr:hypothetical protein [Spirochaetales bacterium]
MMKHYFIPGFGTKAFVYQPLVKALPHVKIIDSWDYSYDTSKSILDKLSDEAPLLLSGWSLGSLYALKYAIEHPGKVIALFLTGFTARFTEKEGYDNGIGAKTLKRMITLLSRNPQGVMKNFYESVFQKCANKEAIIEELSRDLPKSDDLLTGLKALENLDLLGNLPLLNIPVRIYHGIDDPITPLKGAQLAAEILQKAEIIQVKGGHSAFLENTWAYAQNYEGFICTIKK